MSESCMDNWQVLVCLVALGRVAAFATGQLLKVLALEPQRHHMCVLLRHFPKDDISFVHHLASADEAREARRA